jgi:hypothetical protein
MDEERIPECEMRPLPSRGDSLVVTKSDLQRSRRGRPKWFRPTHVATAFAQLFYSFSTAFPQLFHSFSTAFPQLFHSFSIHGITFQQLFHSFSTAFPQLFNSFSTAFQQLFHSFSTAFLQFFHTRYQPSRPPDSVNLQNTSSMKNLREYVPLAPHVVHCCVWHRCNAIRVQSECNPRRI